ncbi:MAG: hypothetical protein IJ456_04835 [Bacteroides sp.]|nr:hypothetical protein [Bacteroides sp.]
MIKEEIEHRNIKQSKTKVSCKDLNILKRLQLFFNNHIKMIEKAAPHGGGLSISVQNYMKMNDIPLHSTFLFPIFVASEK